MGQMVGFVKGDDYDGALPELPTSMPSQYYGSDETRSYAFYIWKELTKRRWRAVKESKGYITSILRTEQTPDITAVDPDYHRRGDGTLLMQYGIDIADSLKLEVRTPVMLTRSSRSVILTL
ncbi:hypothetical protein BKA63DRAFT_495425 [Paraphoma chrysanthemicola]|nr:hypothetical protein BKA63DRAFT_495425 [Paraphoma chrysanthemicola]